MTTVLATTGLSVHFGGVRAVDQVDVVVEEGWLVGLIDPTVPARQRSSTRSRASCGTRGTPS